MFEDRKTVKECKKEYEAVKHLLTEDNYKNIIRKNNIEIEE